MLNQFVIVGRLVKDPEVVETEMGKKISTISIAVPRSYKNANGEYETDFVDCKLWAGIAETAGEHCKRGDLLGIKGRVQTKVIQDKDGNNINMCEMIAEKVTFLSSKKQDEQQD